MKSKLSIIGKDEILVSEYGDIYETNSSIEEMFSDFADGDTYTIYKKVKDVIFNSTPSFTDKKKKK